MATPLSVLIAEDNNADFDLVLRELCRSGFEPDWKRVETEDAFLGHLNAKLDLILSDFSMPQFSGFRALELVRESGLDVPFILMSGTIGEDIAVEAMRLGASDYMLKDRLARLGPAVMQALEATRLRRERQAAADAHRIADAQLSQLLEHSPAVLYVVRVIGDKVIPYVVSESITTVLGFTVEEASTHEWWVRNLHPDDRARALAGIADTVTSGASLTQYRMARKDGQYLWLEDNRRAIRDPAGKAVELIGTLTDITERKRAEEIMRRASGDVTRGRRRRMRIEIAILVSAAMAIYFTAYYSDWFEFVTRWFLARSIGRMDELILTSLFVAVGLAIFAYRRWRETEVEMTSHQQMQAALGLLHDELDRRVQQRTGELDRANDALRGEVDERRKTIEALRVSEAQFRQVVENIHEVFWVVDPVKERVLYVSPTYEKIGGRSCQAAYAKSLIWSDAIHPDDYERVMRAQREKLSLGGYTEEFRIVLPDGSLRWIRDQASPVRNSAGEVFRIVGVSQDVTERKHLEEQFRQAQKMEAIGTLAGGIAHDFNNILTAIIGYTELCELTLEDNPKVRGYLGSVLQAASRATGLVRQILTFSRQQDQERLPIKLLPVVEESLKLLRSTIPTTIEFDCVLAPDTPTVLADATQVHQLIMNLGTNAWYAMKSQPGRLRVRLERWVVDGAQASAHPRLTAGVYSRITVGDTGCGMDEATLRRLFEPFFTTKPPGEGTGLGLAVVHGIMDSHDGAVTVESRVGSGTTFCLYFPEYVGEAVKVAAKEGSAPRGHGERILVIDDEEVLAVLVQRALAQLGYQAEFLTDPSAAVERVRADPKRFALVITDQTMPGMTGLLLAAEMRIINPTLPVLMMTGYTAPLLSGRAKEVGIRELLLKPVTLHSLGVAVHGVLSTATR